MITVEQATSPQIATQTVAVPAASPESPHQQARREVRFGLVLYGGVSLAVYIYGVVLEFERLVRASCGEENAWTGILEKADLTATVDIVSGASAGGINGILLGKALATGAKLDAVRSIWTEQADIGALLRDAGDREPRSLLRVDLFEELLHDGLKAMDEDAVNRKPLASAFDLFIAATRLREWKRDFTTDLGDTVETRDYRKIFQLKLRSSGYNPERREAGYQHNDFEAADNATLAAVARATSAFPVAFEPRLINRDPANERLFLPGEPPKNYFSDGGILHNKPFTETISTIFKRVASRPVDRWLVSVEPDPERISRLDQEDAPNVAEVASKAVLGIPRYQSIAADLDRLQEHRRRATAARKKLEGIDDALLGRIEEVRQSAPGAAEATLLGWKKEVLATSNYPAERQRRVLRTLCERAASPSSAKAWDEHAVRALKEAIEAEGENAPDPGFEQRRIYHLLEMTRGLQRRPGLPEGTPAKLADAKLRLWGQFDRIEELLWKIFHREDDPPRPLDVPAEIETLRSGLRSVAEEVERICNELDGLDSAMAEQGGETAVSQRFTTVFQWFELWDAQLLTIAEVSGTDARDEILFARISPRDAEFIGKDASEKLAGDQLGHFGGFLNEAWRRNDLLWGRLDAAEMICRMIQGPAEDDNPKPRPVDDITEVQRQIAAEELTREYDDYRTYLEDKYDVGKQKLADLPPEERVDLALRSSGVVRNMLHGLGNARGLPKPLQGLFALLGSGLGVLLAFVRRPLPAWVRLRKKLGI